ncbi:hypothetical protein MASR2M47_34960 [Draconibacterium sp.]
MEWNLQYSQWADSIHAFSDQDLVPWLEDKSYNEPIKASFYQIIYVDKDVNIQKDCSTGYELSTGEIHPIYSFNIKMGKGFNVVEYTIDEIFETDPTEIASIPVKVSVSALSDPSKVKFSAKYFF